VEDPWKCGSQVSQFAGLGIPETAETGARAQIGSR
jgi:hypothetical protein